MSITYIAILLCAVLVLGYALYVGVLVRSDDCTVLRRITVGSNGSNDQRYVIEVVHPECKEGMPHTTDPYTIRMTEAALAADTGSTIYHERMHLDQKQNPRIWAEWYRVHWEYEVFKNPPPDLPLELRDALRPNPDTEEAPWALWRGRYLFFPVYAAEEGAKRTLRNARVIVWDTHEKKRVPLPEEWRTQFCVSNRCPSQYEHPHELAAVYLSSSDVLRTTPAARALYTWKRPYDS